MRIMYKAHFLLINLFIILEAFCSKRKNIQETFSERILEKLIGVILTNSKDWEKERLQKKNINIVEENETEENEENVDE